jgi:SAM-dependent methyltransferase
VPKEDPAQAEFWEKRFRENFTPWDAGRVPEALAHFLRVETRALRVLIPGCGSGYEVRAFAEAGHDVIAIDFAPAAVERAQRTLGALSDRVRLADFFEFDFGATFDLIYERAFLCALPKREWSRYAPRVAELLRPGGRLIGFFYFDEGERGPPFGLRAGEPETLLGEHFVRIADAEVNDSIPIFTAKERWQVWKKRGPESPRPLAGTSD